MLQFNSITDLAETLQEADMWSLLQSHDLCISEDHLLHMVKTWCLRHQPQAFQQMAMHIDFGRLSFEQVRL